MLKKTFIHSLLCIYILILFIILISCSCNSKQSLETDRIELSANIQCIATSLNTIYLTSLLDSVNTKQKPYIIDCIETSKRLEDEAHENLQKILMEKYRGHPDKLKNEIFKNVEYLIDWKKNARNYQVKIDSIMIMLSNAGPSLHGIENKKLTLAKAELIKLSRKNESISIVCSDFWVASSFGHFLSEDFEESHWCAKNAITLSPRSGSALFMFAMSHAFEKDNIMASVALSDCNPEHLIDAVQFYTAHEKTIFREKYKEMCKLFERSMPSFGM